MQSEADEKWQSAFSDSVRVSDPGIRAFTVVRVQLLVYVVRSTL